MRHEVKYPDGLEGEGEQDMVNSFGELIRACRRRKDRTLQDVADALGVSAVYVSEVERGKRPPFVKEKLAELARYLEIDFGLLETAALRQRKQVEFDPGKTSPKALQALASLARGGHKEEDIDRILKLLNGSGGE